MGLAIISFAGEQNTRVSIISDSLSSYGLSSSLTPHMKRQSSQNMASQLQQVHPLRQQQTTTLTQAQISNMQQQVTLPQHHLDNQQQMMSIAQQQAESPLQRTSTLQKLNSTAETTQNQSTRKNQQVELLSSKNVAGQQEQSPSQAEVSGSQDCVYEAELLQMKLKKESDKLIQWQVQQTVKTSELEKKLKESEEIRERQKKNIFELQMQLEKESQKYINEIKNREELHEKVENVKVINQHLRDYCTQLASCVVSCKASSKSAEDNQKELYDEIGTLEDSFQKIQETLVKKCVEMQAQLTEEKNKYSENVTEANKTHSELSQKMEQIHIELCQEVKKRGETEKKLSSAMKANEELAAIIDNLKQQFQKNNEALLANIESKNAEITKLEAQINNLKQFENKFNDEKGLNENMEKKLNEAKVKIEKLEQQWIEAKTDKKNIEHQWNALNENWCREKEELQNNLQISVTKNVALETEIISLATQVSKLENQLQQSSSSQNNFMIEKEKLQAAYNDLKIQYDQQVEAQNNLEANLTTQLNEKIMELKNVEEVHMSEKEKLKASIEAGLEELKELTSQLQQEKNSSTEMLATISSRDETIANLQNMVKDLDTMKSQQFNTLQDLSSKLESVTKEKHDAEQKISELSQALEIARVTENRVAEKYQEQVKNEVEMSRVIDELNSELDLLKKHKDTQHMELLDEVNRLKNKTNEQQHIISELNEEKNRILLNTNERVAELLREKETIIEELKNDLNQARQSQTQKEETVRIKEESLSEKEREIYKLTEVIRDLTKEKEAVKKENDKLEYDKFQKQIAMQDESHIMTVGNNSRTLEGEKNVVEKLYLAKHQDLMRIMDDRKLDMDKKLGDKDEKIKEKDKDLQSLKSELEDLRNRKEELQKAKESNESLISKLNLEISKLKDANQKSTYVPIATSTPILREQNIVQSKVEKNNVSDGRANDSLDLDDDSEFLAPPKKRVTFDFSDEGSDSSIDLLAAKTEMKRKSIPHFISTKGRDPPQFKVSTRTPKFMKTQEKKFRSLPAGKSILPNTGFIDKSLDDVKDRDSIDSATLSATTSRKSSNKFFKTRSLTEEEKVDLDFEAYF